jgi:hypothetical protein
MEMLPGSPRPTVATGRLYGLNLSRMKRTRCIQLSLVPRPLIALDTLDAAKVL